ncbi:hypothetical protein [uncultured Enterovirga sp.]|uniref:hypothetical protein n=1 Tax=uncultured Enterovirga sp. TaxID=2026352 RepID=UPI0035CB0DE4
MHDTSEPAATTLRTLLTALVRAALMSDEDGRSSVEEAKSLHRRLPSDPASLAGVALDGLWRQAVHDAEGPDARDRERRVSTSLPSDCPLGLAQIVAADFDAATAAATIRSTAATG